MSLAGHFWTIGPSLAHRLRPSTPHPASERWEAHVQDALMGSVRLTGRLTLEPGASGIVVIVHGMGGRTTSHYCLRAAAAARRAGFSSLRLSLRGSDREGEDFYHAGLTADLRAALTSPAVARHERVFILGYSLGGHVTLRAALESFDPPLRAVAAVCPPLDLVTCARALDHAVPAPYRHYLLAGLKNMYAEVARRRRVPSPLEAVRRARTVREWDELAVVPRHGFRSVDAYYEGESVAPHLDALRVPALVVASEADPMVPVETLRAAIADRPRAMEVHVTRSGGHVSFPEGLDLGMGPLRGLEDQVMGWLARH